MPQQVINVVQGNVGYDLNFTLTDFSGVVVNLVGATLLFKAQLISNPAVQFAAAMSIVSAPDGTCKYTVAATQFEVAGVYNCQIQATYSPSTEVITFPDIQVIVEESVPVS